MKLPLIFIASIIHSPKPKCNIMSISYMECHDSQLSLLLQRFRICIPVTNTLNAIICHDTIGCHLNLNKLYPLALSIACKVNNRCLWPRQVSLRREIHISRSSIYTFLIFNISIIHSLQQLSVWYFYLMLWYMRFKYVLSLDTGKFSIL